MISEIMVLRLRPEPLVTLSVASIEGGSTAIYRRFAPGDSARCRLCPRCFAVDDECLLAFRGAIGPDEAPLFDASGLNWQKGGGL